MPFVQCCAHAAATGAHLHLRRTRAAAFPDVERRGGGMGTDRRSLRLRRGLSEKNRGRSS